MEEKTIPEQIQEVKELLEQFLARLEAVEKQVSMLDSRTIGSMVIG